MWTSKTLHGRHAYELETQDVDKIALNAWLRLANSSQKQLEL
jgi:hypothetical protein